MLSLLRRGECARFNGVWWDVSMFWEVEGGESLFGSSQGPVVRWGEGEAVFAVTLV